MKSQNSRQYEDLYTQLAAVLRPEQICRDEPLSRHTYTKLGGAADIAIFPDTIESVRQCVDIIRRAEVALTVLGNGSNVIVKDSGIRGVTLVLTELQGIELDNQHIIADCGAAIIDVSNFAYERSLTGLEFACGIPGSVGGAVYMNAGAYGGEVKDVLTSALVMTREGNITLRTRDELHLAYRHSIVSENDDIVLQATFVLEPGDKAKIRAQMDELTFLRTSKQPLEYPSCGSVFKRPPGYYAGKLIQDAGLQGLRIGGAEVSRKHAGFIVNVDNATASEYIAVIEAVQAAVKQKFGVALEREVKIIGD
ncbi:UDP-N-acetylmuramate dehydrogenase [Alicyclobacillus curvatus]|jgi:UDP-N-acetylmuramate dehydrogenase|nr:UDP-N-acetylmuramate dehydrogenase [Alicyclobacillus curvatus]